MIPAKDKKKLLRWPENSPIRHDVGSKLSKIEDEPNLVDYQPDVSPSLTTNQSLLIRSYSKLPKVMWITEVIKKPEWILCDF